MARWDDLHRAIDVRDPDGAEQVWLELLETDLQNVDRFLDAVQRMAENPGGRRQAGILLWMLAESLKEAGEHRPLVSVYVELAGMGPDDGTVREGLVEAARRSYPDRTDLDALLEKSGVLGGSPAQLASQAATLASYLRLEPGAYVFHKSGWGVGRVVDYLPDRARCVIDFRGKPGHEMDIDAAASRLERLAEDDVRALALADPKRLRKWAAQDPLEMLRQVLLRFGGSTSLRHVRDALVPDAVATSRWSSWWREAKKQAHLDPRFHVSGGRDARLEFHGSARVDFRTQVERTLTSCPTPTARQTAAREFVATAAGDEEARAALGEIIEAERAQAADDVTRLGWDLVLAELEDRSPEDLYRQAVAEADDPVEVLVRIPDDTVREAAATSLIVHHPEGAALVGEAALQEDDPVLAEVGAESFLKAGRPELLPLLLERVDARPARAPNVYAWYLRGLRRGRWEGRAYEPYPLLQRLLKVLDAVEYRGRRTDSPRDKRGVAALGEVLTSRGGQLVKDAAEATDRDGAHHLLQVLEQNRGLKARPLQKVQAIVLRAHPDALRATAVTTLEPGGPDDAPQMDRVYMTPAGIADLRARRDHLVNEELPANAAEIARAREFGDISENAEYHAARERQALLQARANALNGELAQAVPLTADLVRTDTVTAGARVHLRDETGKEVSYVLLGPPDADVQRGIINYLTPLGQALMGRRPGDHVRVEVHDEVRDLVVLDIENGLES